MNRIDEIKNFKPKHEFFVGIDSDGTVFDTMEIKHKQSFIPTAIKLWKLEKIKDEFREISEKINLYSRLRGVNRFLGLEMSFRILKEKGFDVPDFQDLSDFLKLPVAHSGNALAEYNKTIKSPFLSLLAEWSDESDLLFDRYTQNMKPFEHVHKTIEKMSKAADIMVVSSASDGGLLRDWQNAGLMDFISIGAGQAVGSKADQLAFAARGKYPMDKILMIGDAEGDMKAACSIGALFYPIKVKNEVDSWEKLFEFYFDAFLNLEYGMTYQSKLVDECLELLPILK